MVSRPMLFAFVAATLAVGVYSHAQLVSPPPHYMGESTLWQTKNCTTYPGYVCFRSCSPSCGWSKHHHAFWYNEGTQIGCPKATGNNCLGGPTYESLPIDHNIKKNCCDNPMNATIHGDELRTFQKLHFDNRAPGSKDIDQFRFNPWRAPGYAPVGDPCGISGGWTYEDKSYYIAGPTKTDFTNGVLPPTGLSVPVGTNGTFAMMEMYRKGESNPTVWKLGGEAEVSWGKIVANHGGGYQYRLCPKDDLLRGEACFQENPLDFVGDESWIEWLDGSKPRYSFIATRVSEQTTGQAGIVKPAGSTWTRSPIAPCSGATGGGESEMGCQGFQLPPERAGLPHGFGVAACSGNQPCEPQDYTAMEKAFDFAVVDKVKVPDVAPGEYVLSWRWDCEGTSQVWANCADIKIEA